MADGHGHGEHEVAQIGLTYGDVKRIEDKLDDVIGHLDHSALLASIEDLKTRSNRIESNQAVALQQGNDIKGMLDAAVAQGVQDLSDVKTALAEIKVGVDALLAQGVDLAQIATLTRTIEAQTAKLQAALPTP